MSSDFDAYKQLQVDPQADDIVVEAAFQALARRYHPDNGGDLQRMADISKAYDLLRTPVRRRRYDREHHLTPVGPGTVSIEPPPADPAPTNGIPSRPAVHAGAGSQRQQPSQPAIDFGRYRGWTLKDLAKHDPDYLRWLARSSGGVRYRNAIHQLLPDEAEPEPGKLTPRHRG